MTSISPIIPAIDRKNMVRLFSLAAIWGISFILTRIAAPVLGPVVTADARALIAGISLLLYMLFRRMNPEWRSYAKHYLIVGFLNASLPFLCFSYAGMHIPAGYSALLNATTPLFGAILSALFLSEKMTVGKIVGILCGAAGVALVAKVGGIHLTPPVILSIAGCLVAAASYALTGIYIKKHGHGLHFTALTMGSQLFGGLLLVPAVPFSPLIAAPSLLVVICMLASGIVCTGLALIIYYRMIHDIGPTKALTVTFLVPMFGVLWSALLLDEAITMPMIFGMALILVGTRWVVKTK